MNMTPDNELLARYAKTRSEDAFAELVRRYVDLVYSAASRQVGGDPHLAQDVAQTVFTDLARKARPLSRRQTLSGWLYTSAHFAAAKIARTEHRRRDRDEKFMREQIQENTTNPEWEKLRPALDAAMHELKESDRQAILLRFFENHPFAEVGAKLNLNENAARMRVERALEKLRGILTKRGVTTTVAFATAISANAVQTTPPGLASVLTSASLATAGTGSSLLTIMLTTKLKLGVGALLAMGAATALVIQHQEQEKLRGENEGLRRRLEQAQSDEDSLSNQLAAATHSKSLSQEQLDELLKLRGQIGALGRELARATNTAQSIATSPRPDQSSDPVAQQRKLAEFKMRGAKDLAASVTMGYAEHHQDQFPTNWDQAAGYFDQWERNGLNPGEVLPDTAADFQDLTNEFDLVYQGSWHALTNAGWGKVIVVREKQPFQTLEGKWARTYGFADGHSEVHVVPDGNFDAFEQEHTASTVGP
jgi:RNA polymerase sigma factor (sigma-70 family)